MNTTHAKKSSNAHIPFDTLDRVWQGLKLCNGSTRPVNSRGAFFRSTPSGGDHSHKASSRYPERPPVSKNRASQCVNTDRPLTVSTSLKGRLAMSMITKFCPGCNRDLPTSEFSKHTGNSTGYQSRCRPCMSEQAKARRVQGKIPPRKTCDPVEVERIWAERGGVKVCSKCGHTKWRDQFKPTPKQKDGATPECKDCRNAYERTKRAPLVKFTAPRKKVGANDYGETAWRAIEVSNAHDAWAWWLDHAPAWWMGVRGATIKAKTIEANRAAWRAAKHIKRAIAAGVHVDRISAADLDAIRSRPDCHWCGVPVTKYDGIEWQPTDATIEHVIPLSEGGPHSLDNIVCSCARCNFGRGDSNWGRLLAS